MTGRYSKRKRNNESTLYQQRPWRQRPPNRLYFLSLPPLGGDTLQTLACEPLVRLDGTIELHKIEMFLARMSDEKRSGSEQQRRPPRVEKRNIRGEWECGRRQSGHRMQLHDRHAQYLFRRHQPLQWLDRAKN